MENCMSILNMFDISLLQHRMSRDKTLHQVLPFLAEGDDIIDVFPWVWSDQPKTMLSLSNVLL